MSDPGKEIADATVIILAYSQDRWSLTCEAVESVLHQTMPPREIILYIDDNHDLAERLSRHWPDRGGNLPVITVLDSSREFVGENSHGDVSGRSSYSSHGSHIAAGRDTAIRRASTGIVAFLDDDARAEPDWLERLLSPFADTRVSAVGGAPLPVYAKPRPRWFPYEFDWIFGCAYAGLPTTTAPVLRLIGANLAARRNDVLAIGGLRSLADDLDMCHRLLQLSPETCLIYEPQAIVWHYVHEGRLTWSYFWKRCFWAGRAKVSIMRGLGEAANMQADRRFVMRTVTVGVVHGVRDLLRGDVGGPWRTLASLAALSVSAAGYAVGMVQWQLASWRHGASTDER